MARVLPQVYTFGQRYFIANVGRTLYVIIPHMNPDATSNSMHNSPSGQNPHAAAAAAAQSARPSI